MELLTIGEEELLQQYRKSDNDTKRFALRFLYDSQAARETQNPAALAILGNIYKLAGAWNRPQFEKELSQLERALGIVSKS